ncbi:hypothetical protein L596_001313 [Steinernema carpocapsae]|uniref:Uncharacterized protein n=1 Tax=Steinernema carpocapsae TaxID=34508 RepID=A0A4U8UKN8_STECR|nr:hypothetical protein L596_001313 [Steinernema carpocapsae]
MHKIAIFHTNSSPSHETFRGGTIAETVLDQIVCPEAAKQMYGGVKHLRCKSNMDSGLKQSEMVMGAVERFNDRRQFNAYLTPACFMVS